MRTDLLSKRIFTLGCFGLPWLWICHVLYWRNGKPNTEDASDNDEALVNPDDRKCSKREWLFYYFYYYTKVELNLIIYIQSFFYFNKTITDFPDEDVADATPEEIQRVADKWVRRCRACAILVVGAWIAWIITAQVLRDILPASLYMLNSDDASLTGW